MEDYRLTVPPVPRETLVKQESALTADAYEKQLYSNYGLTLQREQVLPFVEIRERMKGSAEFPRWVEAFVSNYYAIWGQPVAHELRLIALPTLFIVGTRDRTAPGRPFARPEDQAGMGHIAELAAARAASMPHADVITLDTGHLVHLEDTAGLNRAVTAFLTQ